MKSYELKFGEGAYTYSEIATLLQIPYQRVYSWAKKYEKDFVQIIENKRSPIQNYGEFECVDFLTMMEFVTIANLKEKIFNHKTIVKAYLEFSKKYHTDRPFANEAVLKNIGFDHNKIYDTSEPNPEIMDGSSQTTFEFQRSYIDKLDFDEKSRVVNKFWPRGKQSSVVCDPHHSFGMPVISGTNIKVETLYGLYQSNEEPAIIASLYDITQQEIFDAISFYENKAA